MTKKLEELLVSAKEMDKSLVAEILEPYLRIDKDSGKIRPYGAWDELAVTKKILVYLLGRKAAKALGLGPAEEGASATQVGHDTGLKKGTVNPALRRMLDERILEQDSDLRYFVPNHAIEKVKALLAKGK